MTWERACAIQEFVFDQAVGALAHEARMVGFVPSEPSGPPRGSAEVVADFQIAIMRFVMRWAEDSGMAVDPRPLEEVVDRERLVREYVDDWTRRGA